MNAMNTISVHIISQSWWATYSRHHNCIFGNKTSLSHGFLYTTQYSMIATAWTPANAIGTFIIFGFIAYRCFHCSSINFFNHNPVCICIHELVNVESFNLTIQVICKLPCILLCYNYLRVALQYLFCVSGQWRYKLKLSEGYFIS